MATVYRKKVNGKFQSPYYYAVYYLADGKRHSRSTGLKTRRQSQKLADEWAHEQNKARKGKSDEGAELAETLASAFAELNKGRFTQEDFSEYLRKGYEIANGEEAKSPTLKRFLTEWVSNRELHIASSTATP